MFNDRRYNIIIIIALSRTSIAPRWYIAARPRPILRCSQRRQRRMVRSGQLVERTMGKKGQAWWGGEEASMRGRGEETSMSVEWWCQVSCRTGSVRLLDHGECSGEWKLWSLTSRLRSRRRMWCLDGGRVGTWWLLLLLLLPPLLPLPIHCSPCCCCWCCHCWHRVTKPSYISEFIDNCWL